MPIVQEVLGGGGGTEGIYGTINATGVFYILHLFACYTNFTSGTAVLGDVGAGLCRCVHVRGGTITLLTCCLIICLGLQAARAGRPLSRSSYHRVGARREQG